MLEIKELIKQWKELWKYLRTLVEATFLVVPLVSLYIFYTMGPVMTKATLALTLKLFYFNIFIFFLAGTYIYGILNLLYMPVWCVIAYKMYPKKFDSNEYFILGKKYLAISIKFFKEEFFTYNFISAFCLIGLILFFILICYFVWYIISSLYIILLPTFTSVSLKYAHLHLLVMYLLTAEFLLYFKDDAVWLYYTTLHFHFDNGYDIAITIFILIFLVNSILSVIPPFFEKDLNEDQKVILEKVGLYTGYICIVIFLVCLIYFIAFFIIYFSGLLNYVFFISPYPYFLNFIYFIGEIFIFLIFLFLNISFIVLLHFLLFILGYVFIKNINLLHYSLIYLFLILFFIAANMYFYLLTCIYPVILKVTLLCVLDVPLDCIFASLCIVCFIILKNIYKKKGYYSWLAYFIYFFLVFFILDFSGLLNYVLISPYPYFLNFIYFIGEIFIFLIFLFLNISFILLLPFLLFILGYVFIKNINLLHYSLIYLFLILFFIAANMYFYLLTCIYPVILKVTLLCVLDVPLDCIFASLCIVCSTIFRNIYRKKGYYSS